MWPRFPRARGPRARDGAAERQLRSGMATSSQLVAQAAHRQQRAGRRRAMSKMSKFSQFHEQNEQNRRAHPRGSDGSHCSASEHSVGSMTETTCCEAVDSKNGLKSMPTRRSSTRTSPLNKARPPSECSRRWALSPAAGSAQDACRAALCWPTHTACAGCSQNGPSLARQRGRSQRPKRAKTVGCY